MIATNLWTVVIFIIGCCIIQFFVPMCVEKLMLDDQPKPEVIDEKVQDSKVLPGS
jgi:hypothetical protein